MPDQPITIHTSTDTAVFDRLAQMMAASAPWKTLGMDAAACRAGFDGPGKEIVIAGSAGEPMGLAILQLAGSFSGYIQTLFVAEGFRGRGLGKQLLDHCERRIHQFSPNVFICVSGFNTRALRLYEEQGFIHVGTLIDFLVKGHDELLLRKTLGPKIGYTPPQTDPI
jgi:ribosomal protein S18 acetylase RimI-like enzyme